jgi:hypothetical protein
MIPSEPWPCPECEAALSPTELGNLLLCTDPACAIDYFDPGVGRWLCPECDEALEPLKVGSRILRCAAPTAGSLSGTQSRTGGSNEMATPPTGVRWISKGEGGLR